jgi:PAS domain S-box-containing protein
VILASGFVIHRRIARPIRRLSAAVRAATGHSGSVPVAASGPAEVASLAADFGNLIAAVDRELDAASLLTAIVESSTDAMIGKTLDGRITAWNAGAELMYGYSAEEAIGASVAMLVPPDRPDELAGILRRVAGGDRVEHLETQRLRKDGSRLDVSITVSPVRNAAGTVVGASSVARDITDSRRAVQAVRASEARKTAILESALDCIITIDQHGRVVEFNPAAERTFGWPRAAVLGRTMADVIVPPVLRDAHRAGLARQISTGTGTILGRRLELTALRADGTEFPVEVAISRVDLPDAPLFTGYLRDITERKRAEAERQSLEDRLHQSQRLESLGQLAGGVAHDFNNLLAVILNYASFVAERTADQDEVRSDVEQIQRAAERAARLTRQLLIFGRRERVHPEVLDLNAVVSDVRDLLSRSIGEHVELAVQLEPTELTIRADRGQLEQVLVNLAVNARDAMPGGGRLTIETRAVLLDDEYARLHPDVVPGQYVQLSISDTGVGMSPEVLAKVFEPFFTTKPKGHGSGLGLATVYSIVADAGGTVSVYSEEGLGTTVRVHLPMVDEPVPAPGAAAARPAIRGRGETILVVEDEEAMRKVTCRMLRRNGYVVLEAATGSEALSLAVDHNCRLLLSDVVMPQLSGRDLAEAIHRSRPGLPVLFMSGYSAGVLGPQRAVDDDVALIEKPFDERTLLDQVHAALATDPVGAARGGPAAEVRPAGR